MSESRKIKDNTTHKDIKPNTSKPATINDFLHSIYGSPTLIAQNHNLIERTINKSVEKNIETSSVKNEHNPDKIYTRIFMFEVAENNHKANQGLAYEVNLNHGDKIDQAFAKRPLGSYNCFDYALNKATGKPTLLDEINLGQTHQLISALLEFTGFKETKLENIKPGDLVVVPLDPLGIVGKHAGVVERIAPGNIPIIRQKLGSGKDQGVADQDLQSFCQAWTGKKISESNIKIYEKAK